MTSAEVRQIFREELAAFFASQTPQPKGVTAFEMKMMAKADIASALARKESRRKSCSKI